MDAKPFPIIFWRCISVNWWEWMNAPWENEKFVLMNLQTCHDEF